MASDTIKRALYCYQVYIPKTATYEYGVYPANSVDELLGGLILEKGIKHVDDIEFFEVPNSVLLNVDLKA